MSKKPTYLELEQRVSELEHALSRYEQTDSQNILTHDLHDTVFDMNPFSMWLADETGTVIRTNRALRETINLSDDAIVGKYNVFEDDNLKKAGVMEKVRDVFQKNKSVRFAIPWKADLAGDVNFEGARDIFIDVSMYPILDRNGRLQHVVCQWVDITDQKRTERALRQSEAQIKAILDASVDSVRLVDHDMKIIWSNKIVEKLVNKARDEIEGQYCYKVFTGRDKPCPNCPTEKAMKSGKIEHSIICETDVKGIEGISYWADYAAPIKDASGQITNFIQVSRDISDLKIAEEKLKQREALFRGLFDNMISGSAIYEVQNQGLKGSDYIIRGFNKTSLKIEGKTLEQVLGKSLFDLRPTIDDFGLIPVMKKVWETGEPAHFPTKIYIDDSFSNYYENHIFRLPTGEVVTIYNDVTDQKNAEIALIESEARFKLAMEFANDGLFDWNLKTNAIYYSPVWKRMLGYADDELPNDFSVWETLTDPEGVKRSWKMQTELINKTRDRFEIEFKMRHKDGHWVDILSRANAIFDENGEAVRIIGTHVDISDRKRTEAALQQSEQKYRHLVQTASDAIYLIAENGRFHDVNPAACNMLGRSHEEILDHDISVVDPNFDLEAFFRFWEGTPIGHPRIFETTHLHKNGALVPVEVSGQKCQIGENVFFFGVARNISERKKTESELIESRSLLNTLLESIPMPVFYKDSDGHYIGFNRAYEAFYGKGKEELVGKTVFEISPQALAESYHAKDQELLNSGGTQKYESQVLNAKGDLRDVIFNKAVYKDRQGNIAGLIGIILDITEHKKAEQERQKLQAKLIQAQKMESIGNLAGGIAHDFNNILSSIIGFTELALDEAQEGTVLEDSLQEVYLAGKRAKDLVKQILAFARQSDEEMRIIQPSAVAKEVLAFIRSTIPTTIKIKQALNSDAWVFGNATQIHQVLMNLCANAAHAMEDSGGVLALSISDLDIDPGDLEIGLQPGHYVEIKVSDTGVGIAPEIIGLIYEPYFTTKAVGEGTGMGLAMVHGVVESHDGLITVDSQVGKGTTFTIYLPCTKKRSDQGAYRSEALPFGTERILFVDDEAAIAKSGSQMLERLGYAVTTCNSSTEALKQFRANPGAFDLVITDMTMPDLTGDKLAIALRNIRQDIPVILCTGYSNKISAEIASEIGINAFTYKPVVKADLAKTVRSVLDEVNG